MTGTDGGPPWQWQLFQSAVREFGRHWFQLTAEGLAEHLPEHGPAMLVANHSGMLPLDSVLIKNTVESEHPGRRTLHVVADDLFFQLPVVAEFFRRHGSVHTTRSADAKRVLLDGELLLTHPEGAAGLGKGFRRRYQLQDFGRGGFAAVALTTGTPIVPVAVIGAEEAYPMLADLEPLARLLDLPYVPVTPTLPLCGLWGLLPLPVKVTILFGEPVPVPEQPPPARELRSAAAELTDRVRGAVQQMLDERAPGVRSATGLTAADGG
jgi:1-acyl-sn-glycerol-3-phosphate acyltransferase